jgi:hypothetical protein
MQECELAILYVDIPLNPRGKITRMIHYTISAENGPLTEWELEDSAIRGVTKLVTASLDRTALVHRRISTSKRISFLINVQFYLAMLALI